MPREPVGQSFGIHTLPRLTLLITQMDARHFVVENQLFTRIQGDRSQDFPIQLPPSEPHDPERRFKLDSLNRMSWILDEFPFLMAIPLENPFSGLLFDRLHYNGDRFVVPSKYGFKLRLNVLRAWEDLELNLRAVVYAMAEICQTYLPKTFRFWAFPKRYGYTKTYTSQAVAQSIAIQSRDSFIPLIATATFFLVLMETHAHPEPGSTWRETVLKKTGIHHQWLSDLELSIAGDFKAKRVGGIMRSPRQLAALSLPLSQLNMPLFVSWGLLSDPALFQAPNYLKGKHFVPTSSEIQALRSGQRLSRERSRSPLSSPQASLLRFPPVDPLSRQRPGEKWEQFFARHAYDPLLLSPLEKQKWESRAKNAVKQAAPGKKGARVFVWDDVDGFRVRRHAGRKHVDDIWEAYGSKQRRYDALRDEWDLCSEFGENSDDGSDDEGPIGASHDTVLGALYEETAPLTSLTELLPDDPLQLPLGRERSTADLQRVHGLDNREEGSALSFSDTAEDRAYYWYGFVTPDYPLENNIPKSFTWRNSCEFLGNGRWLNAITIACPTSPPSMATQGYICTFFERLLSSQKVDDMPTALYDLSLQLIDKNSPIYIHREAIEGIQHYFIRPHESKRLESIPWQVQLTSAPSVMEIIRRRWGTDLVGLVGQLLDRGIPFRMPITGPLTPPPAVQELQPGLGYRPANYQPDAADYAAYLSYRDSFLRSPKGRAALMHGGIVSRLAREAVPYQHVFDGPTLDVFSTGAMLPVSSVGYWDDCLTEHEINLICGVYKVDTGNRKSTQTADLSWWPKPSIWSTAGINLGFWSEDCERWFQGQLSKLENGEYSLKNPAAWRNGLKFYKPTSKITTQNEKLAAEYLMRCL
ncbi:hypothetical protein H0H93_008550 [Arthromyces matolae]|nr:hypothetical protein H0H93_008550 [Arthromyces matolae]